MTLTLLAVAVLVWGEVLFVRWYLRRQSHRATP